MSRLARVARCGSPCPPSGRFAASAGTRGACAVDRASFGLFRPLLYGPPQCSLTGLKSDQTLQVLGKGRVKGTLPTPARRRGRLEPRLSGIGHLGEQRGQTGEPPEHARQWAAGADKATHSYSHCVSRARPGRATRVHACWIACARVDTPSERFTAHGLLGRSGNAALRNLYRPLAVL